MTPGAQTIGNHDCRLWLCHAIGDLFQIRHNSGGWPCQVIFIPRHFNKCVRGGGGWGVVLLLYPPFKNCIEYPSICPSIHLKEGHSEVSDGPWPLQIYGVNLARWTPQAHFNPITPCCTSPNLTLTTLNIAVQIMNLIKHRGHVRTCPSIRPSVTNFISLSLSWAF